MHIDFGRPPVVRERWRRKTRRWTFSLAWGWNKTCSFGCLTYGQEPAIYCERFVMLGWLSICLTIWRTRRMAQYVASLLAQEWGVPARLIESDMQKIL